jgi:eukaryotic-like serine/threonine-protein kinase
MISDVDRPPMTLGDRYQLLEVVGQGGMGEVWAARDLRLNRDVAVKRLSPQMASQAGVRERFEAEARAAARLNHPNVVVVYDSGEHEGTPYLVMELLSGRTLGDELALGPLDPERVRSLGLQVLDALAASHRAGILHRDIKPGNLLVAADGSTKVGDFGIAKSTEGLDLTSTGMIVGTAAYLAPERLAGEPATPQADLYALGVVLYEALTGRKPFQADTPMGLVRAVEAHNAVPLAAARPGLDPSLAAAVERAMAADPTRRFASAADMAAALSRHPIAVATATVPLAASPPTSVMVAATTGPPDAPFRAAGRRGHPATVVGVVIAAVVLLVVALAMKGDDPSSVVPGASSTSLQPAVSTSLAPPTTNPPDTRTPRTTKKPKKDEGD